MRSDHDLFHPEKGFLQSVSRVDSIDQYLRLANALAKRWNADSLWFRGVSKASYLPIPGVYREPPLGTWIYDPNEANLLFDSFVHRAKAYFSQVRRQYTTWEWYHLMQHYGLPTRLLDWTEGSLIGLYFALRGASLEEAPAIWVLDPYWLNGIAVGNSVLLYTDAQTQDATDRKVAKYLRDGPQLPSFPVCIVPPYIDDRLRAQKSCFTVHGKRRQDLTRLLSNRKDPHLAQIVVDGTLWEELRESVINGGITESIMFPDLEGLARELRVEHGFDR